MNVIPVINCPDVACVRAKLEIAKTFLHDGEFVHLDVTDGLFAAHQTLNDPRAWAALKSPFSLEGHLMVENPMEHLEEWLVAGMKRCVVHIEVVRPQACREIVDRCAEAGATVMLASDPETPADHLHGYFDFCLAFQVLAVNPGAAGQEFLPEALDKIRFIRASMHDAIIEVDGGMNPQTALLVRDAGADTIVSASYIFNSADPKKAYEMLKAI